MVQLFYSSARISLPERRRVEDKSAPYTLSTSEVETRESVIQDRKRQVVDCSVFFRAVTLQLNVALMNHQEEKLTIVHCSGLHSRISTSKITHRYSH